MMFLFITFLVLVVLCVLRRLHQKLAEKRFKYAVFSLRDSLRRLAIDGTIDSRHWYFDYIDKSFSYSINDAYYLTLNRIILKGLRAEEDEDYLEFKKRFDLAVKDHPEVGKLVYQYQKALHKYLVDQHRVGYTIFIKPIITIVMGAKTGQRKLVNAMNATLYLPKDEGGLTPA